jgi:hypothetical protein
VRLVTPGRAAAAGLLAVLGGGCGGTLSGAGHGSPVVETTARLATASPSAPGAGTGDRTGSTPGCTARQVTATASTDRPAYGPGTSVTAITVLTNRSAQSCTVTVSARDPGFSVSGTGGQVWRSCGPGQTCPLYERLVELPPGGQSSVSATWDERTCTASACDGPRPAPGAYRMTAAWSGLASASTFFTLG